MQRTFKTPPFCTEKADTIPAKPRALRRSKIPVFRDVTQGHTRRKNLKMINKYSTDGHEKGSQRHQLKKGENQKEKGALNFNTGSANFLKASERLIARRSISERVKEKAKNLRQRTPQSKSKQNLPSCQANLLSGQRDKHDLSSVRKTINNFSGKILKDSNSMKTSENFKGFSLQKENINHNIWRKTVHSSSPRVILSCSRTQTLEESDSKKKKEIRLSQGLLRSEAKNGQKACVAKLPKDFQVTSNKRDHLKDIHGSMTPSNFKSSLQNVGNRRSIDNSAGKFLPPCKGNGKNVTEKLKRSREKCTENQQRKTLLKSGTRSSDKMASENKITVACEKTIVRPLRGFTENVCSTGKRKIAQEKQSKHTVKDIVPEACVQSILKSCTFESSVEQVQEAVERWFGYGDGRNRFIKDRNHQYIFERIVRCIILALNPGVKDDQPVSSTVNSLNLFEHAEQKEGRRRHYGEKKKTPLQAGTSRGEPCQGEHTQTYTRRTADPRSRHQRQPKDRM